MWNDGAVEYQNRNIKTLRESTHDSRVAIGCLERINGEHDEGALPYAQEVFSCPELQETAHVVSSSTV